MDYVKLGAAVVALLLAAAAATAEIYRETHCFRVTRYDVSSEKLAGIIRELKILFLSDLHNCTYGNENERLLRSIRDEEPDLILIGGDMLVGKEGASYETAQQLVKQLPDICRRHMEIHMKPTKKLWKRAECIFWRMPGSV